MILNIRGLREIIYLGSNDFRFLLADMVSNLLQNSVSVLLLLTHHSEFLQIYSIAVQSEKTSLVFAS